MSGKLEPGGLAMIIASKHPENLGKIVLLVEKILGKGRIIELPCGNVSLSKDEESWIIDGENIKVNKVCSLTREITRHGYRRHVLASANKLMPLNNGEGELDEESVGLTVSDEVAT